MEERRVEDGEMEGRIGKMKGELDEMKAGKIESKGVKLEGKEWQCKEEEAAVKKFKIFIYANTQSLTEWVFQDVVCSLRE